jgi:hypothetical protein
MKKWESVLILIVLLLVGMGYSQKVMLQAENLAAGNSLTSTPITAPWIDVRKYESFSNAIDAIGESEKTLLIPNQQGITVNTTIPANITLWFLRGGRFTVSTGVTVIMNGPIKAGLFQIFKGSGSVKFGVGAVNEVYPQWWGAVGDNATDCAAAINAAILSTCTAAYNNNAPVVFPAGKYLCLSQLNGGGGMIMKGAGPWDGSPASATTGSVIIGKHTGNAVLSLVACNYVKLQDLQLYGSETIPPRSVLLLGRSSAASAGNHIFDGIHIVGYSTFATVLSVASESNSYRECYIYNYGGGAKYTYWTGQGDPGGFGLTGSSNIDHRIYGCTIGSNQTDATGSVIYFTGGNSSGLFYLQNSFLVGSAGHYVTLETGGTDGGDTPGPIVLENVGGEPGSGGIPTDAIYLVSAANKALKRVTINNCGLVRMSTRYIDCANPDMGLYYCDIQTDTTLPSVLPNVYNSTLQFTNSQVQMGTVAGNTMMYKADKVGIGTGNPGYTLEVNGTAGKPGGGTWSDSSDERLKQNINRIDGRQALNKLLQLQGVTFDWINPQQHAQEAGTGVVAQQVEAVFPEWVHHVEPAGSDKVLIPEGQKAKAVSFPHAFNAYLIEAIKEQQRQIETLQTEIRTLKKQITVEP